MINKFGKSSTFRLFHLNTKLALLCYDVLVHHNISILCTTRNKTEQTKAYNSNKSKAIFGESPHNYEKSFAVDVGLWNDSLKGVDSEDVESFKAITDCFKLHAESRGIEIECGIDWGWDMPHVELKGWRDISVDYNLVS